MTTALFGALAGLLGAVAVGLARAPRVRLRAPAEEVVETDADRGLLFVVRWPFAVVVATGAWAFVGGRAGLLVGVVAGIWAFRILRSAEGPGARARRIELARDLPIGVDLLGSTVAAGGAVSHGLVQVAAAFPGALAEEFEAIHHRLALGADPVQVWREVGKHDLLGPLGHAMVRAHESGAAVGAAITALAEELRDSARFEVEARARSVDVKSAGPLGVCLLPAFVLIGLVPTVAGLFLNSGIFG